LSLRKGSSPVLLGKSGLHVAVLLTQKGFSLPQPCFPFFLSKSPATPLYERGELSFLLFPFVIFPFTSLFRKRGIKRKDDII